MPTITVDEECEELLNRVTALFRYRSKHEALQSAIYEYYKSLLRE